MFGFKANLATEIGLQNGDKILTIDGKKVRKFSEITIGFINGNRFTLERKGEKIDQKLPVNFISKLIDRKKNAEGPIVTPRYPFIIGKIQKDSLNAKSRFKS